MPIWSDFPYTDFHSQNIDFILKLAQKLNSQIDAGFGDVVNQWIEKHYNELFFNATYNPETETITFSKTEKQPIIHHE